MTLSKHQMEFISKANMPFEHQKTLSIVFIEDTYTDVELIQRHLRKSGLLFNSKVVETREAFIKTLDNIIPDVILSDHSLPQFNSIEALEIVKDRGLKVPFILVTGSVSEEFAVACIKAGADDYILKDRLTRLAASIQTILSKKNTEREKDIISILNLKLQAAYEEINSSIKYAKRIQRVILPAHEMLGIICKESFIFYSPKDIVSGDFFWCTEKDDKIIVAAIDCTGHGVPGAFMSIIGNNLLDDIINNKGITDTSEILHLLNQSIRYVMKQESEEALAKDGMDVSICCLDQKNSRFEFSGANRPLFYYHNQQLIKVRGEKQCIGGFQGSSEQKFIKHTFNYSKGDKIYLFTDGYPDQFGGNRGKKMMTKNLVHLLNRIQNYEMKEQRKMVDFWFKNWKGENDQTDDVLLVGIELL